MCLNLGADLFWRHAVRCVSPLNVLLMHRLFDARCAVHLTAVSQDGRTLLHFACQQSANTDVIIALLQRLGTNDAIAEVLQAVDEVRPPLSAECVATTHP